MKRKPASGQQQEKQHHHQRKSFHLEWKNSAQKVAFMAFEQHDVLFLIGPAGSAKTHLAVSFAINEILSKKRKKIILSRPIVEAAGEKLGYLPGTFEEKINPYLLPIFDCMDTIVGRETLDRERVDKAMEIAPIAYLRGRTFNDSIIILDEAQNAKESQLKLAMSRLGINSKIIITGDATQTDLRPEELAFPKVVEAMKKVSGISIVEFNESHIVRHPMVKEILGAWPST